MWFPPFPAWPSDLKLLFDLWLSGVNVTCADATSPSEGEEEQ